VVKFLIDENLSQKIAMHFERDLGLDAVHVRNAGSTGLPDRNVGELAIRHGRVIVTLDSDFLKPVNLPRPRAPGVLWFNPSGQRSTLLFQSMLDRFFAEDATNLDIENSVIEITELGFVVHHKLNQGRATSR